MSDANPSVFMRSRILGVLMKDARQVKGQTVEACAEAMGCEVAAYEAYERGESSPSLPELELFAFFLDVPLAYFWGDRVLSEKQNGRHAPLPAMDLNSLRDRIIGAQLREARLAAGLTPETVAEAAGITPEQLTAYEFGRWPVPVPELELIAQSLGTSVEQFFVAEGPVGEWDTLQRAAERVRQLPPDLRAFVSQPLNEGYLRLAQQLSELPVERLRGIASSLLEITY